jgi:hypothetical protein
VKLFCRRCRALPGTTLLLPTLLLTLAACQRPEEPPVPADLLGKEKIIRLLADLHQLEAQVENSRLPADSARALYLEQQKSLFWRHETTDSLFQRSYRYGIHGKDLTDIYVAVIDTLKKREEKFAPLTSPTPAAARK